MKKNLIGRIMGGALAVMLALPMTGMWGMPLLQVSAAGDADDSIASQPETTVTKVQAEAAELSLEIGLDMSSQFVKEEEPNSDEGGHIKTSKIGATVTLTFEGPVSVSTQNAETGLVSCQFGLMTEKRRKSMNT